MTELQTPDRIGPYRLVRRLGEGGMGVVHLAYDEELGRRVALKWLHQVTPATAERLRQEAHLHARVEHPAVCRLYRVGEHEGRPFLVMQYIDGRTADKALADANLEDRVRAFIALADGVHAAHRQGLIHRDLKPANLMVAQDPDGTLHPYVMDFGLARDESSGSLTEAGMLLGSPAYMAPEQVRGEWVDPRTDVYGLGASFYEILGGRPPFTGEGSAQILVRTQTEEPPPLRSLVPGLARDLETILATAMAKDPARRYPSAAALRDDLQRFLDGTPILARRVSALERLTLRIRRNRVASGLALGVAALALALAATWIVLRQRAQAQAYWAQRFGQEVLRMDSVLRFGRMLPPHDVARELAVVRRRMEDVRAQMAANRASRGPGHFALGEGHLILDELDLARRELEAAWTAGFRPAEASLALGRCMALQYQGAMAATQGELDAGRRQAKQAEVRRTLFQPAVAHLDRARRELGSLALEDQARLALAEDHFDDAERLANAASAAEPWRYDALFLLAKARALRGRERLDHEEKQAGREDLEAALRLVEELQRIGPSDDRLQDVAKFVWSLGESEGLRGLDALACQTRAVDASERMLALNSTRTDMLHVVALHLTHLGLQVAAKGRDPEPWFRRAEDLMRGVVEAPPGRYPALVRGKAFERLANLAYKRAGLARKAHQDPDPMLAAGLAFCHQALAEGLGQWETHQNIGFLEMIRAEVQEERGIDAVPALRRSAASLRDCANLNPTAASFGNLAELLLRQARVLLDRLENPKAPLEEARQALDRAHQISPGRPAALALEGDWGLLQARYSLARSQDPGPPLEQGLATLTRALKASPQDGDLHATQCLLLAFRAGWHRSLGRDAQADSRQAWAAGQRALALKTANGKQVKAALAKLRS